MALTARDILMDADLFRRAYPSWPSSPDETCLSCGHPEGCPCTCCYPEA